MRVTAFAIVLTVCLVGVSGCAQGGEPTSAGEGLHSILPDATGQSLEAAEALLEEAGYEVGQITTETVGNTSEGTVLRQEPVAGTSVPRGGSVDLVLAAPSALVVVPDAVTFTIDQARMLIREYGLLFEFPDFEGDPTRVKVTRQEPAAGTEVEEGTTVILWTK